MSRGGPRDAKDRCHGFGDTKYFVPHPRQQENLSLVLIQLVSMKSTLVWLSSVLTITPTESKPIKACILFSETGLDWYNAYTLHIPLVISNQGITFIIRTEQESALLVWKEWYENKTYEGACDTFKFSCFSCPEPCSRGRELIIPGDEVKMEVYGYPVNVFGVEDVFFGLIGGQEPPPGESPPANCLGLKPDRDNKYFSIMNQLRQKSKLSSAAFTLFLRPTSDSDVFKGGLVLGGVDPTQYTIPLRYVPLLRLDDYAITLRNIHMQEGSTILSIDQPAVIRTGRHFIGIPQLYFSGLAKDLEDAASKIAGQPVELEWDDEEESYMVDCDLRQYMPTLTLYFGSKEDPAPLLMTHQNYVREYTRSEDCIVMIRVISGNEWELPDGVLIGNYVEFHPNGMKLGIARLKF